jgi:uncharacterized protein
MRARIPGSARALACSVRRLAERTVDIDSSRTENLRRRRRKQHAGRVRSPATCVIALLLSTHVLFAAEVIPPKPDRYFNDYAHVVSPSAALRFNEQLAQFERETSNQVVVAVFPKMQSASDVADFTHRIAQNWGVGTKERRNGVVLFVFVEDHKMFIQVGYGLEGALPDATAFDITEFRVKPHFRTGDYEGGLATGIESILQAIRGEYKGSGKTIREQHGSTTVSPFVFFIIFIFVLMMIARATRRRGGYGYSGRGGGPIFIPMGFGGGGGGWSSGGGGFSGFSGGGGSFGGGGAGSSW